MKLHILHRTRFKYATSVRESFNEARLQPVTTGFQVCHSFLLKILPTTKLSHYLDFYFNYVHLFDLTQAHTELVVEATSTQQGLPRHHGHHLGLRRAAFAARQQRRGQPGIIRFECLQ